MCSDANEECNNEYGTQLTFHSSDEQFLMNGFSEHAYEHGWIGYFDATLEPQNTWICTHGSRTDCNGYGDLMNQTI